MRAREGIDRDAYDVAKDVAALLDMHDAYTAEVTSYQDNYTRAIIAVTATDCSFVLEVRGVQR